MKNILFVCTGNSCRSVMAEGFLRDMAEKAGLDVETSSAGVGAIDGYPSTDETIRTMKEYGIDMSDHRSRRITREMAKKADAIFVMETFHREAILSQWPDMASKTHLLAEYAQTLMPWGNEIDIPDPIRMSSSFYQNVSRVIRDCVSGLVAKLGDPPSQNGR